MLTELTIVSSIFVLLVALLLIRRLRAKTRNKASYAAGYPKQPPFSGAETINAPMAPPQAAAVPKSHKVADTSAIFQEIGARATVPLEMERERTYSVRITLTGEKLIPGIEKTMEYYEESSAFEADPAKTLRIEAQTKAFNVEPKRLETRVPTKGKSAEHDFLVTPLPNTNGRQKLLFQIFQQMVHLATLNADIDVRANPRLDFSEVGAKFRILSTGLRREYDSGVIPLMLLQYFTTEIVRKLNTKDYEELRYLLILLIAGQPPYRNHGNLVKGAQNTYAFTRAYLREVAREALRPMPSLDFEYFRGANRVLENRLEKSFDYVRSFKDNSNLTWYYLTPTGLTEALRGLENLLMKYCANQSKSIS